ncbi:serine/threonine-protein kinase PknK [Hyalangium rubrum]|uniref:Protein kinase n=1 Tax=Hyalangium rubrum TaxID=3103134 RepID=A0ABU5GXX7_9BACT|nr:protein kinase [Hyalangium sp. s54d21]MDY7226056.1 protein kinase [Hyalangium sp. s54d21]
MTSPSTNIGSLPPGTMVGEYVIDSVLSSGGFGVVYHARDPDQRQVAIKVSKHSAKSITAQQLVWQQNEIEALTRLKHPALVEVLGYGFLDDGRLYLVMELVNGVVLGQYLQEKGPLEVLEALQLTRRIAEALAYCHESNVLHLDLKPANIIITDPVEPKVKVLDFGLARLSSGFKTHEGGPIAGTLAYMAPECFFGAVDRLSEKVDLYAVGTLLYEMLSCVLPFPGNASYAALGSLKRSGKMTPMEETAPLVPAPVAAMVRSLLDPDPAQRFGGAGRLATRLKGLYFDLLHGNTGDGVVPSVVSELVPDDVPFVGRAREMALVREAVDAVADRQGRALMLVGEAGMGKSRLVSEVLLQSDISARALVGYGRCRQLGELVPYSPLREALGQMVELLMGIRSEPGHRVRSLAGQALAGEAHELRRLVPELSRLLPDGAERGSEGVIVQGMGAERVGKALTFLLTAIGAARPLVLVLEDVHWADEGTLAVLTRLTANPPPGVLLLCTTRPPPRLSPSNALQMVTLSALEAEENDRLLATLAGGAAPTVVRSLLQSVPFLASGNPLVSSQIIRDLQLGGYLSQEADGRIRISERLRGEYQPPDSVTTVVARALERLEERVLRVLRVAARIDRRFRPTDLEGLGLFTPREVRAAITAAEEQRLCVTTGDRCTFAHDILRERLATDGRLANLPDIHRRIGERLLKRGAPPGTLAYHWEQAGEPLRAAAAYLEAGLEADKLLDPIGASQHLRKAFTVLGAQPASSERDDMLVKSLYGLVRIGCLLGSAVEMLKHLEFGQGLLAEPTPEQRLALNSAWARAYYAQGNFPKAMEYSEQCLDAATEPSLRHYMYAPSSILGRALSGSGRFGPSIPMLTEATDLSAEAGETVEQAHSEGILALALAYTGEYKRAREHAATAARLALRLGNPVRMAASTFYYATIAEAEFHWDEGVQRSADLLAFTEAHGITGLYVCMGNFYAGRHQFHIGRLNRARHLLQHALGLAKQQGSSYGMSLAYAYLGDVEFVAGRVEEAKASYEKGLELANAGVTDEQAGPLCLIGLAHLKALAGGPMEEVRAKGDEALQRLRAVDNVSNQIPTLQRYAEALEELGDAAGAARLYEERQVLVKRLGLLECDFWPRVAETALTEPLAPRQYWRKASTRLSSSNSRPVVQEDFNAETVVRAAAPPPDTVEQ